MTGFIKRLTGTPTAAVAVLVLLRGLGVLAL